MQGVDELSLLGSLVPLPWILSRRRRTLTAAVLHNTETCSGQATIRP
jgi:hypothetical protein